MIKMMIIMLAAVGIILALADLGGREGGVHRVPWNPKIRHATSGRKLALPNTGI